MSSRYSSFTSSHNSSSPQLPRHPSPSFFSTTNSNDSAIVKVTKKDHTFGAMVKKFMDKKKPKPGTFTIPKDVVAADIKKTAPPKKPSFSALPNKLFRKPIETNKVKALTEVKPNTRTLAMVLRSERELLALNQQHHSRISQLQSLLTDRSLEVDKLKDLCLKQREEIKALKSAILFPDEMNSQLHHLLDEQGSELKQAKQAIPSLQKQISSLTGQLQCLSQDLAQVKAAKYAGMSSDGSFSSPRTPVYNQQLEEPADSLDFSSDDLTMPNSPDNLLLKDVNPCLTPAYSKTKSKQFDAVGYEMNQGCMKLSRSSDHFTISASGSSTDEAFCRSDENRYRYRNRHIF